jgi:hypothetical protein
MALNMVQTKPDPRLRVPNIEIKEQGTTSIAFVRFVARPFAVNVKHLVLADKRKHP